MNIYIVMLFRDKELVFEVIGMFDNVESVWKEINNYIILCIGGRMDIIDDVFIGDGL